jgi:hypothetical protein
VCDERGAASYSISARHSFEFRILATHVAKKLICVSRVLLALFGGASVRWCVANFWRHA